MTKYERLSLDKKRATFLRDQGRAAEGWLQLEKIIDEWMPKKKPNSKKVSA